MLKKTHLVCLLLVLSQAWACDPQGKKQCAWMLEPEAKLADKVEAGYIPVCARNRQTMKQDCRLQTTLELAKQYYGKTFRYHDLEVASVGIPRTIVSIRFCDGN